MKFEVGSTPSGQHTVVRQVDGRPIIHGQKSLRFVQQMCDVLNKVDAEVDALEPFPDLQLAYSNPELLRQQSRKHAETLRNITSVISAAYERLGVDRIHV